MQNRALTQAPKGTGAIVIVDRRLSLPRRDVRHLREKTTNDYP